MKTKQMALTLMFFVCFALFFTGCRTTFSLEVNVPEDKILASTQAGTTESASTQEATTEKIIEIEKEIIVEKDIIKPVTTMTVEERIITVSVDPRSMPLTRDIVKNIQHSGLNLRELDYYLSKSFAMTILERKDTPKKLEISEGVLKAPQEQSITTGRIEFTPDLKGAMSKDIEASSETFVIVFNVGEDDIPLTFKRNSQGRYDLVSAMINADRRTVFAIEDDPPQLCILAELNEHLEMLAILNSKPAISQSWQSYEKPAYQKIPAGGFSRQSNRSKRIDDSSSSRRIDDPQSSVTIEGITKYVKSQNPNVDLKKLSELFDTYKIEAAIEGINLDIAIAQMLYATSCLRNRMTTRNYAGLGTNGVRWDGTFPDMRTGVKAHIQHLKGYVSTNRPVPCVDPRYDTLVESGYWGKVNTFDELFGAWSQNPDYGDEINRILNGLY